MGITFTFTPPARNPAAVLLAASELAEEQAAHALLDASQPLVPVEEGVMRASGRVVPGPVGHAVTYGSDEDGSETHAPSNVYTVRQHEDQDLHHPNGGEAKWLEKSMNGAHEAVAVAAAIEMKRAFR
jgi:hypothetical protein